MIIKVNSYGNLTLNKMIKLHNTTIAIRSVFQGDKKYYHHAFLDKCLYKLKILGYDRIDISEEIDVNTTNASKNATFVIIGILKTLALDMNHIFAIVIMV